MVKEIAVLQMRLLFKKATASVAENFAYAVKKKYNLLLSGDMTPITSQIQE